MKKIWKRAVSLCLASILGASAVPANMTVAKAEEGQFDMSATSPTGNEDWGNLRIDMGSAETNNNSGYRGTPLANGLFAAKENGGVTEDVFALNHSTFWSGDPAYRDYIFEGNEGYENSQETRNTGYNELVGTLKSAYTEGIPKAERDVLMESIADTTKKMWESDLHSAFISAGRMKLAFPELTNTTDYQRILDLDTATSEISFKKDDVGYLRETFISNPDNVMVTRLTNEANNPMGMTVSLELHPNMNGKSDDNKVTVDSEEKEIVMTGRAPYDFGAGRWSEDRGTLMESRAKVVLPQGGDISIEGNSLKVTNANEIIVLYTSETSFKDAFTDPSNSGVDYSGKVRSSMDNASQKSYDDLRNAHLEEYRELFRRFWIDMDGSDMVTGNGAKVSPYEYARHYQYGRYVNIACERANSVMPQGLLGMWSASWKGPNEGAYFLNENMEKMQALKGAGNLQDSSVSQYNYIKSWADERTGQRTAKTTYGAEDGAWVMSHSTGIWAKSGMWGGTVEYGSWLAGGIWALDSLYDKYDFTEDIELLSQYYPLLEGAAKFALSTLIEVDGVEGELKGYKVVAPAGSPEHWYWVGDTKVAFDIATTSDTLLYYNLFNMLERGAKDLKRAGIPYDEALLERVLDTRSQMMPLEMFIDEETGRLKEWYNEYAVGDERHRHASHLLGLFLGHIDINEADTPELFYAQQAEALRWMNANGGTHPDRSLMAMRAGYEDFAFENLTCGIIGTGYGHDAVMQWTAIASSIAESVVDSRFDQINIMENLPSAWSSGTVKGIRARGGYQLSMTWENGEIVNCVIDSPTGETPRVLYKGEPVVLSEDGRFTVNRAGAPLDDLIYEAQNKLEGKYTQESKAVLQEAIDSNNADTISDALMAMEPINFITTEVKIEGEDEIKVLTEKDQTLQLTAKSDKEDASYKWSIEKSGGGNANQIATIDDNGIVTALGGGRVTVTAAIEGEPRSKAEMELFVELDSTSSENIDDRDSRIKYTGNWATWEESKHANGTITYSSSTGSTASLDFSGVGIEYVGSSAGHIGDFKVIIDDEVVADRVSSSGGAGYGLVMYSKFGLEAGDHTITIESLGDRLDMDAFNVYEKIAANTNRKELIKEYYDALEITDENYPEDKWNVFKEATDNALITINNFDATQDDITAAKETLQEAVKSLEEKPVADKKALQELYDENIGRNAEEYLQESWLPFENAMAKARVVLGDEAADQAAVDAAWEGLQAGINGLVEKPLPADKTELQGLYDSNTDKNAEDYTEETWEAFDEAMKAAYAVLDDETADQKTVDEAIAALETAIKGLVPAEVPQPVEKEELQTLYDQNIGRQAEDYTEETWGVFDAAMIAAKEMLDSETATQEDVDQALQELRDAILQLKETGTQEDIKELLRQLYEANISRDESKYTPESWKAFKEAMESAKQILDNPEADSEQIDASRELLQNAISALAEKPPVPAVSKTMLQNLYSSSLGKDQSRYTENSWNVFSNALNHAKSVLSDERVSQKTVDEAYAELVKAVSGLEVKPAPVIKVTEVRLSASRGTLYAKGASVRLSATVLPSNAAVKEVTWKSRNKKVATVDSKGKVTAVGNGKTDIIVTTKDGGKTAKFEVKVKFVKKPAKVTDVKVKKISRTTLQISWDKVKDADSYKIYIYKKNRKWKEFVTTKRTNVTITGLSAGTKYVVKAAAVNKGGRGSYSSELSTATKPVPTRLNTVKKCGTGKAELTFKKVSGAKLAIYMSDGKNGYKKLSDTNKTSIVVKGLKKGKTYKFKARTYVRNSGKNYYGSYSNVIKYKVK